MEIVLCVLTFVVTCSGLKLRWHYWH